MLKLPTLSLRSKQTLIIMLTSSVALLLACAAFVGYDTVTFRRKLVEELSLMAGVMGNNCAAAIDFNDSKTAGETLAALREDNSIVAACVYSREGRLFAAYQRDPDPAAVPPAMQAPGQTFTKDQLHLFRPIQQRNEMIGMIFVASDLKDLSARRARYISIVGAVFLGSLLIALALSSRLQRVISDPILNLGRVARSVALERNYAVRAVKRSDDELGQLVDGFNEMLAQIQARDSALQAARDTLETRVADRTRELEDTHRQLLDASRQAGMAEIATNVLHNVGNVLNSVNVSTDLLVENVRRSRAANLGRVVALLREHAPDLGTFITTDARGKHVPAYLAQLSDELMADQAAIVLELESLRKNVGHIKEIVAMQQTYATFGGVKELINIVALVEDSININETAFHRDHVEVIREFENVPPVNAEKHKILQILVNLLRNAKHACLDSDRVDKRLNLRVTNSGGRVRITVTDNGIGIPPENLTRIFSHGFTTRKGGHGFGLHSSALAAKEMGGSLAAYSEGPGKGATFTLDLPLSTQENLHE